jgi:hypothetical protein
MFYGGNLKRRALVYRNWTAGLAMAMGVVDVYFPAP